MTYYTIMLCALAFAGCTPQPKLELEANEWVCTKETVASINPYRTHCTQYSRLAR